MRQCKLDIWEQGANGEYQLSGKRCPRSNFLLQFPREICVVYGDAVILTWIAEVLAEARARHPFAVVCQRRPADIVSLQGAAKRTYRGKHWDAHGDLGKFGTHQLSTWFLSMTAVLEVLTEHFGVLWERLGELAQEHGWFADLEPVQSMVREVLWSQLVRYWGGTVESVTTSSPCDLSTVLHWRTAMRMLAEFPDEQYSQVSWVSLVHGPPRRPTHAWVADGHCHLELLRQWVSVYATVESTVQYFM